MLVGQNWSKYVLGLTNEVQDALLVSISVLKGHPFLTELLRPLQLRINPEVGRQVQLSLEFSVS